MKTKIVLVFLLTSFFFSCSDEGPKLLDAESCFTYSPLIFKAGEEVKFSNCSKNATEFAWDFGDGVLSTQENPSHTFKNRGNFLVRLVSKNKSSSVGTEQSIAVKSSKNHILSLGDGRVEGKMPNAESFRYELWKELVENNWNFDFIGTRVDAFNYPTFANKEFYRNHEGLDFRGTSQILDGINDWLGRAGKPDIVLFSSPAGVDGLTGLPYQKAIENINAIIDIIQLKNPNVTIIIEQAAPVASAFMTAERTAFFDQLRQEVLSIAKNQTTATSKVIVVDMFTGFEWRTMLADGLGYNSLGAKFVAKRFYDVLEKVLEK
jgi:PKD repeat protein